jgi:hypothetical protein
MDTRRLSGVLAHIEAGGPEGENARRILERFVDQNPEYGWTLDGGAPTTREVACPTAAHRVIAGHVAAQSCCLVDLSCTPGEVPVLHVRFTGPEGAVRQAEERFLAASDRLDFLVEYVGATFVAALGIEEEDQEEGEDDEPAATDPWSCWETDRLTRVARAVVGISVPALRSLANRLVDLVAPVPRRLQLVSGRDLAWDDPQVTFVQFARAWQTRHPHSTLEMDALQGEYRAGRRMDPLTGRLKHVPGLERPWGTPLPKEQAG